jgi:hypothetical protein
VTLAPELEEQVGPNRTQDARGPTRLNGEEVTLISYLPTAFTTLFVLAASLLLGYLR